MIIFLIVNNLVECYILPTALEKSTNQLISIIKNPSLTNLIIPELKLKFLRR